MKFKISVADLQYAMRIVKDVVPSSGPLSDASGVQIEASEGRAVLTAFNPELMAKATVKIDCEKEGSAVLDAQALYSAISHFKPINDRGVGTSDISVGVSGKSRKLQVSAKTRYASGNETPHKRVFALKTSHYFPEAPPISRAGSVFDIPAHILMEGLDSVSFAASTDGHQVIFTGVLFQLDPGKLTLFATNGVCLAEFSSPVSYEGPQVRVILPLAFTRKLSKSFFVEDSLNVMITNNMMFVKTPNLLLGGTLIREEYPDYKKVLTPPEKHLIIDKHVLLDNLLNMGYEASQIDHNRVTVDTNGTETSLYCGESTNGGIPSESSEKFKFDCNLNLFSSCIKNLNGEKLRVGYTDAKSPIYLLSTEEIPSGYTFNCVIVPLS